VQFVGAYTVRATKKRFFYPGAAFFHIKDGKILHARFYSAQDEVAEVQP
jgi:ketosteroid isomerase-like protein